MMTYEELQDRLAAWAATQPLVRAVIITGSRARGAQDRVSDLDAMILTTARELYATDPEWLEALGTVRLWYVDVAAGDDPEWYVLFDGNLKLDVALLTVRGDDESLDVETLLTFYPYQNIFERGVNIIFDRLGEPRVIPPKPRHAPPPPTAAEYERVIRGFLLASTSTAKFLTRGDLWRAQTWFSHNLRRYLLRMIEWNAYGRDTWYSGRNIERWAGEEIVDQLPQVFAQYDRASLEAALWATLKLFRQVAEETGARFEFSYPAAMHDWSAALVDSLLKEQA